MKETQKISTIRKLPSQRSSQHHPSSDSVGWSQSHPMIHWSPSPPHFAFVPSPSIRSPTPKTTHPNRWRCDIGSNQSFKPRAKRLQPAQPSTPAGDRSSHLLVVAPEAATDDDPGDPTCCARQGRDRSFLKRSSHWPSSLRTLSLVDPVTKIDDLTSFSDGLRLGLFQVVRQD